MSARVTEYLRGHFPGAVIECHLTTRNDSREYRVMPTRAAPPYRFKISSEFRADHPPDEVRQLLENWKLAGHLITAGSKRLVVTNRGVSRKGDE
jgi:hypothetical protein